MKVGEFIGSSKSVLQIEKSSQVHQLVTSVKQGSVNDFLSCVIRVWNNKGQIIPPMTLRDLVVLNGDEYPVQVGFDFPNSEELIVLTYEICDEGSLNKTVYVELDLTNFTKNVELDSIDVTNTTAVKMRNYNFMNIVSPAYLPKNSVCIFAYADILSLQKNNDLMGLAEILTHSNCILREGTLSELHPVVYDNTNSTEVQCMTYTQIAKYFVMGYDADLTSTGYVIIRTGEDNILLSPQVGGCQVVYCEKELTKIAQQVQQALITQGQIGNVDSNEFASAVASVGKVAEQQGKTTNDTQSIANKVINLLPSVRVSRLSGIKNFNLASESVKKSGLNKTL